METSKWIVINEDTGEIVDRIQNSNKIKNFKILANEIDDIIKKQELLNQDEFKKLLGFMYTTNELNKQFNQIKLEGVFVNNEKTFGLMGSIDNNSLASAYGKLLYYTSWNNMVKKNSTTICENWNDVMGVCGILGKTQRASFKKFLTKNNIVKKVKCIRGWRMFVNPKIKRNGSHVSQKAVLAFWNETKNSISKYSKCYFYNNGDISKEEK